MSFHRPKSIILSRLRPRIGIPRGDVIARILLQRVGLRLRALRIELLAKFAFALRCLGSFLVVRVTGQLSVLLSKTLSTEPVVWNQCVKTVPLVAITSKQSQPFSWAHASVACCDQAPWCIGMYAPQQLLRRRLWAKGHFQPVSSFLVYGHLVLLVVSCWLCLSSAPELQLLRRLHALRR
jgi:hypothetical protein